MVLYLQYLQNKSCSLLLCFPQLCVYFEGGKVSVHISIKSGLYTEHIFAFIEKDHNVITKNLKRSEYLQLKKGKCI